MRDHPTRVTGRPDSPYWTLPPGGPPQDGPLGRQGPAEDGQALHPTHITKRFVRLVRDAGLRPITLHGVRHSYATAALAAGEPLKVVSERLGHASTSITANLTSTQGSGVL
jgi:integrase